MLRERPDVRHPHDASLVRRSYSIYPSDSLTLREGCHPTISRCKDEVSRPCGATCRLAALAAGHTHPAQPWSQTSFIVSALWNGQTLVGAFLILRFCEI